VGVPVRFWEKRKKGLKKARRVHPQKRGTKKGKRPRLSRPAPRKEGKVRNPKALQEPFHSGEKGKRGEEKKDTKEHGVRSPWGKGREGPAPLRGVAGIEGGQRGKTKSYVAERSFQKNRRNLRKRPEGKTAPFVPKGLVWGLFVPENAEGGEKKCKLLQFIVKKEKERKAAYWGEELLRRQS